MGYDMEGEKQFSLLKELFEICFWGNEIKSVSVSKHFLKEHYFSCDDYESICYYLDNNVSDITRRYFKLLQNL